MELVRKFFVLHAIKAGFLLDWVQTVDIMSSGRTIHHIIRISCRLDWKEFKGTRERISKDFKHLMEPVEHKMCG